MFIWNNLKKGNTFKVLLTISTSAYIVSLLTKQLKPFDVTQPKRVSVYDYPPPFKMEKHGARFHAQLQMNKD